MTPESQRIAIAETLGATWEPVPPRESYAGYTDAENDGFDRLHPKRILAFRYKPLVHDPLSPGMCGPLPFPNPKTGDAVIAPDYLNDLNAMHEAEKAAEFYSYPRRERYLHHLQVAVNAENISRPFLCATAAQRAEAFLRTLSLWKEQPC